MEDSVAKLVKQAAVRSLSCELVPNKEGEMYFGDERRGHVLSHTFFLKDSQARGFQRWFSIVVFMRDKHFLLNAWKFIQVQLTQLVQQLQARAAQVCEDEQKTCSQRAARLAEPAVVSVARPITTLTATQQLYAQIHLWFTWMLRACSQRLEPFPPLGTPADLTVQSLDNGFLLVNKTPLSAGQQIPAGAMQHDGATMQELRVLQAHLGSSGLTWLVYTVATGRQLIVRGPRRLVLLFMHLIKVFVPPGKCEDMVWCEDYAVSTSGSKPPSVIGLPLNTAVPMASASVHRVDIIAANNQGGGKGRLELDSHQYLIKSGGSEPPSKLPTLVTQALGYVADTELSDGLACSLLRAAVTKWAHTADMVREAKKCAAGSDMTSLLLSLGAQEHDQSLIEFWSS